MDTLEKVKRVREIEREIEASNAYPEKERAEQGYRIRLLDEQQGLLRDLGWSMVALQETFGPESELARSAT